MPSESAISVSVIEHRSSTWYQSVLLRASRDTSRPTMMPTLPRPTAATRSVNPSRPLVQAADLLFGPAQRGRVLAQLVLQRQRLGVLLGLGEGGLADVDDRVPAPVTSGDLSASRPGRPARALTHRRTRPRRGRPGRPARSSPRAGPAPAAGPARAACSSGLARSAHLRPGQAGGIALPSNHACRFTPPEVVARS